MAGIGFTLKKLFKDEYYTTRTKAYVYSALVSAGPWIAAVITVNLLIFMSDIYFDDFGQRDLFMGTIVYSFVFSQIVTAPWQLLITRYISDSLFQKEYRNIRSSFFGLSRLVFFIAFAVSFFYYLNKGLPFTYKVMALVLFVFLSLIWILMVYLSALKNYAMISYAYIIGGSISIGLAFLLVKFPLPFDLYAHSSNVLFAYTIGIVITYGILMYSFLTNFYQGNRKEYDFLRYMGKFKALMLVGLFYTLGLWIDDLIMWYSPLSVDIYQTYKYAPLYDNAMFLAYLTVIPTMILFMVSVETEFYDLYKKYYGLAAKNGTFKDLELARLEMRTSVYRQIMHTMEVQTIITVTLIVLSGKIFAYLGIPLIVRDIFRIASLGALCNIFVLVIILILLYFEGSRSAVYIAGTFLLSNGVLTYYFLPRGIDFYGVGYFIGSFVTLIFAIILLVRFLGKIHYNTFALQPLFIEEEKGVLVNLSNWIHRTFFKEVK